MSRMHMDDEEDIDDEVTVADMGHLRRCWHRLQGLLGGSDKAWKACL